MTEEPLGNHAQFIRGVTFKPTDKCEVGKRDSLVCLRTANVQQTLDESDLIAIPANIVKNPEKLVRLGDILVSSANSWNLVGRCCRVESLRHPSAAGGFISILRADPSRLDPSYLYRWFASDHTQATVRSLGNQTTNISNLDHKRTLSLRIPLPPLPEQKRIAAILDAADALRAKRRESIEQLDSLTQATFLEMFGDPVTNPKGWEVTQLQDLGDLRRGISTHRPRNEPSLLGGAHPLIQTGDVANSGGYIRRYASTYSDLGLQQSKKWPFGTLCITIAANIAATGILTFEACFPDSVVGFLAGERSRAEYVREVLRAFKVVLDTKATQVAQKNINLQTLRTLRVPSPPVDLQNRFASIVESIEHQKAQLQSHLAELDALFSSLQSRAFNGELVA